MEIDIERKGENTTASTIFLLFVIVVIVALPIYGYIKLKPYERESDNEVIPVEEDTEDEEDVISIITGFEEEFGNIDDQPIYIAYPTWEGEPKTSILVIYSHGSITEVSDDMSDPFMLDLRIYGQALTKDNFIFAASNQHGVNWGNDASVEDTYKLYQFVNEKYDIEETVYLIGFSMGGLPTMNFTYRYPELVSKIAMLAPTTKTSELTQEKADLVMDIPIKIWHGDKDVNVGYVYTQGFINKMATFGKEVELVTLEGKTHWDIHIEYIQDILDFFKEE